MFGRVMRDGALTQRLAAVIRREGPIPFDRFMEAALYDPDGGFFAAGGGAGRSAGDFITSPEVGSLFGALVAEGLDRVWETLDKPDPYVVVDAGAGRGQLARDVLRAAPRCGPALRYVMVERSAALRALQHEHLAVEPAEDALGPFAHHGTDDDEPEPVAGVGPIVTQTEAFPSRAFVGAVIANELLDNLPFRVVERAAAGWCEVRVAADDGGGFAEVLVPADPALARDASSLAPDAPDGTRVPIQTGIEAWLAECSAVLRRGYVAVIDYAMTAEELPTRPWLRTFRSHKRGESPLHDPGTQDITSDVLLEALRSAAARQGFAVFAELTQAEWLRDLGVDALVDEGRRQWDDGRGAGDLAALAGRSRVQEADALLDPAGLGAHRVVILSKG